MKEHRLQNSVLYGELKEVIQMLGRRNYKLQIHRHLRLRPNVKVLYKINLLVYSGKFC